LFFIKHKWGVKGKSVTPSSNISQIKKKFKENQHIIQIEVKPMLLNKRKFVIRSHVLLKYNPDSSKEHIQMYIHKNCIVLEHSLEYDANISNPAIHISSLGKSGSHPTPYLLTSSLYEESFPQMKKIAGETLSIISKFIENEKINSYLYHLFGYDFIIRDDGIVVLLEVNSYPALGNGTMSKVPKFIFEEILKDFLNLTVLPITEGIDAACGGFIFI